MHMPRGKCGVSGLRSANRLADRALDREEPGRRGEVEIQGEGRVA